MIEPGDVALDRATRALVATGSGMRGECVIPGQDNGPAPPTPFATVTLLTDVPESLPYSRNTNEDVAGRPTIFSKSFMPVEVSYSVTWLGAGARSLARRFAVWAGSPAGVTEFARRGLTFYRVSAIRNLTGLVRDDFETRHGLDLFLGVVLTDVRDVGMAVSADVSVFPDEFSDRTPDNERRPGVHWEEGDDRVRVPIDEDEPPDRWPDDT